MIISSKQYAEKVEDVVCGSLEDALKSAFDYITRHMEIIPDYYERDVKAQAIVAEFQESFEAEWRDRAIELFEKHGMDVTSDGKEF